MNTPKIVAYLKPTCGWSQGVRAIMGKYNLPFEDRDIINDPAQRQEMMEKSGQMLSPCVEVNGCMLADVSGEEVEAIDLQDRKSTRLNSSHSQISYAVFCLKKKKKNQIDRHHDQNNKAHRI